MLLIWFVAMFSIPLLAWFIDDVDVGVFVTTSLLLGPLAFLLARSGARDDGEQPSAGFAQRAPSVMTIGWVFGALALVAAGFGNPAWSLCFWMAVFAFALARSWGYRFRSAPHRPE